MRLRQRTSVPGVEVRVTLASRSSIGFSTVDLLFTIAFATLLTLGGIGMTSRESSARAVCGNNLRQIGMAVQQWGNDHGDEPPWAVRTADGGTFPSGGLKPAIAWAEFITVSNGLSTPRVFVCPKDPQAKVAADFSNGSQGFANSGFRGNALSYFLSYHGTPTQPRSVIGGDRDVRASSSGGSCSRGVNGVATISTAGSVTVAWTNLLHANAGHVLAMDGAVTYAPSAGLAQRLTANPESNDVAPNVHFIGPR